MSSNDDANSQILSKLIEILEKQDNILDTIENDIWHKPLIIWIIFLMLFQMLPSFAYLCKISYKINKVLLSYESAEQSTEQSTGHPVTIAEII
jgi:hypothetical protein